MQMHTKRIYYNTQPTTNNTSTCACCDVTQTTLQLVYAACCRFYIKNAKHLFRTGYCHILNNNENKNLTHQKYELSG